jgi:hypothetical protein
LNKTDLIKVKLKNFLSLLRDFETFHLGKKEQAQTLSIKKKIKDF